MTLTPQPPWSLNDIRVLTLDLDNTVWPIEPVVERAQIAVTEHLKRTAPQTTSYLSREAMHRLRQRVIETFPERTHDFGAIRYLTMYSVGLVSGMTNAEAGQMAEETFRLFYDLRNEVTCFHGVAEVLPKLATHYSLAALTNGNADLTKITDVGRHMDHHVNAAIAGHLKPHRRMFDMAHRHLDVQPEQTIHVGDHAVEDIEAARAIGAHALWFNPGGQPWPLKTAPPMMAGSWSEVAALLLEPRGVDQ